LAQFTSLPRRSPLAVAATLLIACEGGAPVACGDIPEQRLFVRQTSELQPCFEDPDGERITVSASSSNANVASVIVLGQAVRIKAVATGSATITVVATDPHGAKASLDIEVTVSESSP